MSTPSTSVLGRTLRWFKGEVGRRLVHASGAVIPAVYVFGLVSWRQVTGLFVLGSLLALTLEWLRLYGGLEFWVYDHLTREYEEDNPAGYLLYMLSALTVTVLFQPDIAIPAILMLSIADPLSGMASSGELRLVKRPRALLTMFLASAVIAALFLRQEPLAVLFGGIGATAADGLKPRIRGYIVDDNLTIPTVSAAAMQLGIVLAAL